MELINTNSEQLDLNFEMFSMIFELISHEYHRENIRRNIETPQL